jgi:deoxyadenosine/deoxycytidine kinase
MPTCAGLAAASIQDAGENVKKTTASGPRCIAIEGNISSGKSTETCGFREEAHTGAFSRTHVALEFTPEALLQRMYTGSEAYGFQLFVFAYRACQFDTVRLLPASVRFVADRTLLGDVVFANVQRAVGNITAPQMADYAATLRELDVEKRLAQFDALYYLHVSPEECRRRCTARAHAVEDAVTVEYFRSVQRTYADALVWLLLHVPEVPLHVISGLSLGALPALARSVPSSLPRARLVKAQSPAGALAWPHVPNLMTLGNGVTDAHADALLTGLAAGEIVVHLPVHE